MSTRSLLKSLFDFKASIDAEMMAALKGISASASGADFPAALRVLNHACLVDRIFAANLQRLDHGLTSSWTSDPPGLDALALQMRETDSWYVDYVSSLSDDALEEQISFAFTDGQRGCMSREEMLAHVITHAGYHRGEAARLLPEIESVSMRDVFAGYLHGVEPLRRGPAENAA